MKRWLLNLIKYKISVSPIVIRDESGRTLKVIWHAQQRGTNKENHGDSPTSAAEGLIVEIESGNNSNGASVA